MFKPVYIITSAIASALMKIEALRQEIITLPITPSVLASLRESAKLTSTHYSTQIEGNRLTQEQVIQTIKQAPSSVARTRDQKEVLGYYAALDELENLVSTHQAIAEQTIKLIHGLVMGEGKKKIAPTPYREGQNAIYDGATHKLIYLPPEAPDVPNLMADLAMWLAQSEIEQIPCPLRAAIAHYQFATIHPYYDGNGRTARLLATLILHQCGYDLKGIYSLEEYYAKNLPGYYDAITVGDSHNYYMGRAEGDITKFIEYFCLGMVESFENVKRQALQAQASGAKDQSHELRLLDARQRMVLSLFKTSSTTTAHAIAQLLKIQPRTARALCQQWIESRFFVVIDAAKKSRRYGLNSTLEKLLFE